ncbi:hypothetical protein Cflav_PD5559 [Pedosphaera parvula Ellin514]|uniref:Uncharacterized protein n=1 Tax=Pedosphaera parvula (strain Ellin514) TaxID=320771 RepID=B9XBN9_PEDPL|nr:hypothetical protein Cflav_PD5559 [Pedosphaera parvula Ellin514]
MKQETYNRYATERGWIDEKSHGTHGMDGTGKARGSPATRIKSCYLGLTRANSGYLALKNVVKELWRTKVVCCLLLGADFNLCPYLFQSEAIGRPRKL